MQNCSGGREPSLSAVHLSVQRQHQCVHTGGYEEEHWIELSLKLARVACSNYYKQPILWVQMNYHYAIKILKGQFKVQNQN